MITPIKTLDDLQTRLNQAKQDCTKRDQLALLCREMYEMKQHRRSTFLPSKMNAWRSKVAAEYYHSNNRPHNAVNLMTSVLAGNTPQYTVFSPGDVTTSVPSRAELWLQGVWQYNSLRQQTDVYRDLVFHTVLDGAAGLRVYWNPNDKSPDSVRVVENPDAKDEESDLVVMGYGVNSFPIVLEVIPITNLFPVGRGALGRAFDQIFHVEMRVPADVLLEWEDIADDTTWVNEGDRKDFYQGKDEYVEWWGRDKDGTVWHAVAFRQKWLREPRKTMYPDIPYICNSFLRYHKSEDVLRDLPFLYSVLHASNRREYVSSRMFRNIDLYANLPPIHIGGRPKNFSGTWGEIINLEEGETIQFPKWPGQPPDLHQYWSGLMAEEEEGTFSSTMYGQPSPRMSGYAMSQVVGADTIKSDNPRANLELTLNTAAHQMFKLLGVFSPGKHISVLAQVGGRNITPMLAGNETGSLVVHSFVKPKHLADDVRMAALGAQLASLPDSPVSMHYLLERYFGIAQPEFEIERKMAEQAMKDPVVRLIAILEVLEEQGSPHIQVVQQQLQKQLEQLQGAQDAQAPPGQMPPGGPPGMEGVGMGLPQAVMGNAPIVPPSGNVVEEAPDRTTLMRGGPVEE